MSDPQEEQRRLIIQQFTKQAIPFSQMPYHDGEDTNRLVLETAGIGADDTVLDVACGPGLITAAVARVARHVTGIDITPAMIEEARKKQQSLGLANMAWKIGDILPLPFADAQFSVVLTRYSFHHFLDPQAVFREMVRVCRPGGQVVVVDVFMSSPEQSEAFNRMDKLRDPSHTRALLLEELTSLFHEARLSDMKTAFYRIDVELEQLLSASCTTPDAAAAVRRIFEEDLGVDRMGVGAARRDGAMHFAFPIVIMAARRGGTPNGANRDIPPDGG